MNILQKTWFYENDINDPALAAALAEAGISTGRASITRKDSTDVIADMGLTESDMQDPELLKELQVLGYVEAVTKTISQKQTNKAPLSLKVRMNEYNPKLLASKKAYDLRMQKSIIKSLNSQSPV